MEHDHHEAHGHDHHGAHGHVHVHAPKDFGPMFAIATALNVGLVAVQVFYGIAAHSVALLADAGHNFGDALGLMIAWGAYVLARLNPTARYTYGFRSASILAALLNGAILLVVTGAIAWEAIQRFFEPGEVAGIIVMVVAAIGIVINGLSAWLLMAGQKGDLNVRGAFLHMAGDAGVSLGVVIAGGLIILTGWNWLDPTVSIFISAMIVWGTWRLLREAVNMALDAVPPGVDPAAVRSYLSNLPGVSEVHDLTNASRDKAAKEAMHARAERDPSFGRFRAGARGDAAGDEGDGKQVGRCLSHDTLQYFRGKGQTTLGAGEYRRHEAQCLLLARFYRSPRRSDMSEVEGQADIAGTPSIRRC